MEQIVCLCHHTYDPLSFYLRCELHLQAIFLTKIALLIYYFCLHHLIHFVHFDFRLLLLRFNSHQLVSIERIANHVLKQYFLRVPPVPLSVFCHQCEIETSPNRHVRIFQKFHLNRNQNSTPLLALL